MASNPPYVLRNTTKDTFLFSAGHDQNLIPQLVIKGGSYIVFNKSPAETMGLSDEAAAVMFTDVFSNIGKGLTLADKDGTAVTPAQFKQDNP